MQDALRAGLTLRSEGSAHTAAPAGPPHRLSERSAVPDPWALLWAHSAQTLGFMQNTCFPSGPGIWGVLGKGAYGISPQG